ncbi:Ig-like domain-containing protein [Bacteroidota bacterium]
MLLTYLKTFSIKKSYFNYLVAGIALLLHSGLLLSGPILVHTRDGQDVSESISVASDHIHIEVPDFSSYISASYKLYVGTDVPSSWESIAAFEFYEDLYFYKKLIDQHILISLKDAAGSTSTKVISLQGGVLSGHVDDPILPVDLVHNMKNGLIVEADVDKSEVDPEHAVVAMKKAGIGHVRMHIGRLDRSKNVQQDQNNTPEYYALLDRWVSEISRHGLYCHIGNKGNSVTETVLGIEHGTPTFLDFFLPEMVAWWTHVTKHFQYSSHRLAFHLYLESGKINELFGTSPDAIANLKMHYQVVCDSIRAIDSTRNIMFPPGSINNPERLKDVVFPTSAGKYFLSDFHKGFAGGEWHPYEEFYGRYINAALDWMSESKIPLFMSAVNAKDRVNYPTILRVEELGQLFEDVNSGIYPVPVTFLTLKDYWDYTNKKWFDDYDKRVRFEVINGVGSVNPDDPDGDFLTSDDEINKYGTDPENADTDRDNISDFAECLIAQLDPLSSADGWAPNDLSIDGDLDGDGISNAIELKYSTADLANSRIIQTLDITDPNDSETSEFDTDQTPNVWEAILGFNMDDRNTRYLGNTEHDSDADHDGDGVSTIQEIKNNTWPIDNYDNSGDRDRDYALAGDNDIMPYVHDSAYIVGYEFKSISDDKVSNQARQGSDNTGTIVGNKPESGGGMLFDSKTLIDIPKADFLLLEERSIHFHFMAGNTQEEQVLYAEGNENSGLSIALSDSNIVATTWNNESGEMKEVYLSHAIDFNKWYAITVIFDGGRQVFKLSLYAANRPVVRINTDLLFDSATLADASGVTLGGTFERSRLFSISNSTFANINGSYFYGYCDDFHIYNRVLSETEVSLLSRNDLFPAKDLEIPALPDIGAGHVPVAVTGLHLEYSLIYLTEGEDSLITASVIPDFADDPSISYYSSDTTVVLVDSSGLLTAKSAGSAVITLLTHDGGFSTRCFVTVEKSVGFADPVSIYEIRIYPNPARHSLHIEAKEEIVQVEIYSLTGAKLVDGTDISRLSEGMYIIAVSVDGRILKQKFCKID